MAEPIKYTLKHVGINTADAEDAAKLLNLVCYLFNLQPGADNEIRTFAPPLFEIMKGKGRGQNGHIGLATPDVEAAMKELSEKGIEFNEKTIRRNDEGKIIFIYFKEDIAGFAFHLTQA